MIEFFRQRFLRGLVRHFNNWRIRRVAYRVARYAPVRDHRPVVFFKASTGIDDLSWNSGFHLIASWAMRLQGIPVVYFACHAGMSRCVLGTNRDRPYRQPPCKSCIYQSRTLYSGVSTDGTKRSASVLWFEFERDRKMDDSISGMPLEVLVDFQYQGLPLGRLCVTSLRWILRRYHLEDSESTRFLMREYILSAWNVARKFTALLDQIDPAAVILFNGQFYPEATARYIAQKRGLRVITHEVGFQPASAFFTGGEATAYPIHIPDEFELSGSQNARLDAYLQRRFQGKFTMAGIQFWPEMRGLGRDFDEKAKGFKQIVPIFTNVIFDTSQPHANSVFNDMFEWLEYILEVIKNHPETLFILRSHPDETRLRKESRETVQAWVDTQGVTALENVIFVGPKEYLSSYELIQRSKFVMVYNSTIGLEASIMGVPVLCSGKARFTQYPTVFFPQTIADQKKKMEELLDSETIVVPSEFQRNARRFLYYQLFKTSLLFGDFLEASVRKTQTRLKSFTLESLLTADATQAITRGLVSDDEFLLD